MAASQRVTSALRDAAIVLGIAAAILVGLEATLRWFFPQEERGQSIVGPKLSKPDSVLGMRYVPGARWRITHPEYQVVYAINADGFRDEKRHVVPKPPGLIRVLLLGDSFTFGHGVNYDETWAVLAERELERRGEPVGLVKAGIQGSDTRSALALLRELAPRYDPDLVVIGFLINDLYTNRPPDQWAEATADVFRESDDGGPMHLLVLARRLITSSDAMYARLYISAPGRGEYLQRPLGAEPREKVAVTEALFAELKQYCDSIAAKLVVLSIPQQFQVLYGQQSYQDPRVDVELYDRHFSAFARDLGFAWVPTLDLFQTGTDSDSLFYRLDGHLTPAGNAIVARALVERVLPVVRQGEPVTAALPPNPRRASAQPTR